MCVLDEANEVMEDEEANSPENVRAKPEAAINKTSRKRDIKKKSIPEMPEPSNKRRKLRSSPNTATEEDSTSAHNTKDDSSCSRVDEESKQDDLTVIVWDDEVFQSSCLLLSAIVENKPLCVRQLHAAGVTDKFLDSLSKVELAFHIMYSQLIS